jgi:hypothetical protein
MELEKVDEVVGVEEMGERGPLYIAEHEAKKSTRVNG